VEEAILVLTFW